MEVVWIMTDLEGIQRVNTMEMVSRGRNRKVISSQAKG